MATFIQYVDDVLAIFAHTDPALAGLPVELIATGGSTTTIVDGKLGRGTAQATRYDGRRVEIVQDRAAAYSSAITVDGAHSATTTALTASGNSAANGDVIEVNSAEKMLVTAGGGSTALTVVRGLYGTTAVALSGGETINLSIFRQVAGVDNGGFNGTTTLTLSPAFTTTPIAGDGYRLYPQGLSPDSVRRTINEVIRSTDVPHLWTPTLVDDGDFEANDLTKWAALGSPSTRAFITTPADVLLGERALHLIADAATEGVESGVFRVTATENLLVSIFVRVNVGSFTVVLRESTGAAATVRTDTLEEEVYTELRYSEVVPAGIEDMLIRFASVANLDDCFISPPVTVQSQWSRSYVAPSWLTEPERQVEGALILPQGHSSPDVPDTYAALTREFESWETPDFIRADRFVNRVRVQFRGTPNGPISLYCHRTFDELAADTDTTNLDRQYVAHQAAVNLTRFSTNPTWQTIHIQSRRAARQIADFRGYGLQRTEVRERLILR